MKDNRKNLFQWIGTLFKLFNNAMKTNIYVINENDLVVVVIRNKF